MKKTMITGLVVTLGLLLMGSAAYGAWHERGPHDFHKDGYGCRYADVERAAYCPKATAPVAKVSMPCRGYWQGKVKWTDDRHYSHDKKQGYRGFGLFGRCW